MELSNPLHPAVDAGIWTGRQQAFAAVVGQCKAAKAASLKQIRETRAYEHLGVTWDAFCVAHAGVSRQHADDLIRRYNELGAEYFRLAEIARISADAYRAIAPQITAESIEIDGESIPIIPENGPKIRAGIRRLRAELKDALDNHSTVLADLYHRIDSLTKDVHRFHVNRKGAARETGMSTLARYAQKQMRLLAEDIEKDEAPSESQ
jgi:hypothetical protein